MRAMSDSGCAPVASTLFPLPHTLPAASQGNRFGCTNCPAGTYAPSTGYSTCLNCPAGYFSVPGATNCTACPYGWMSPSESLDSTFNNLKHHFTLSHYPHS